MHILTAMDCDEAVMPPSSLSDAQEGSGTAMLVGLLEAWITRRDIIETSSAAEYLLCGSDLWKVHTSFLYTSYRFRF